MNKNLALIIALILTIAVVIGGVLVNSLNALPFLFLAVVMGFLTGTLTKEM